MDSYDYFKSGSVGKILQFAIKNKALLKLKKSAPVTKINSDFQNKWVLCDMVGKILIGGCSCMEGNSKTCSHALQELACGLGFRSFSPPYRFFLIFITTFKKVTSLHI